jgi:hypothetical protein
VPFAEPRASSCSVAELEMVLPIEVLDNTHFLDEEQKIEEILRSI